MRYLWKKAVPISFGEHYSYTVKVKSKAGKVTFKLEGGPEGMKVSRSGKVTWKVPRAFDGSVSVILMVTDGSAQELFHSFTIDVVK